MRVDRAIIILALVIFVGWGMGATDPNVKIGMIDLQQLMFSTDEGRDVRAQLERKIRAFEAKLQPRVEHFQQLQQELQEMRHVLSKEAMQKRQFDLVDLKGQLENESAGFQQQLKVDEARLVAPLQEKLLSVVDEIGRREGFSLIIQRGPPVMYSREALDITDLVIEAVNKTSASPNSGQAEEPKD